MKRIYCIALICIFNLNFQGMNDIKNEDAFSNKELLKKLVTIQNRKIPNNIFIKPEYERIDDNFFQIKERPDLVGEIYNNEEENNEDQKFLNNLNGLKNQVFEVPQVQAEAQVNQGGNPIELGCCCLVPSSKIKEANNKIQNGNVNINNANTKIQRLNVKNNQLVNVYNSLSQNRKDILIAFDNEINRLKVTRDNALKEKSKLEQEKNNLNTYIAQLIEQINSCKEKYRKLGMYDKELDDYSKTLKKNYEDLLGYFNEATNVAKESEGYLNKLEKKELQNDKNIDLLKAQNTSLDNEIKRLKSELTLKGKDIDVLNGKLESSNEKNTSLEKNLDNIKIKLENVQNEKQTLNDLKIKHEEEIESSNQKIEDKEKQIKLLEEQIEELNNTINTLEIKSEVEKKHLENEKKRLEEENISKKTEIETLQKDNKLLQEKNLELNNTYNKNIKEINEKNSKFLNLYIKEVQNNNNKHNELFQAITKLNLDWNKSFNTLNDDNNKNIENIINSNKNFNKKKQEEFNTTINDFIEEQKKMIEYINESNNEKLKEIFNYYKETLMDFENKYKNTVEKFEKQANNYENTVKELEKTLNSDSAKNSTAIIQSVFNLTSNINGNFKKTCEELNNQKEQFSDDVKKLENNIDKVINENVNKIKDNMSTLENNIKDNVTNLNNNNIEGFDKTTKIFKEEVDKKNEENIKSNENIKNSLNTLTQNIEKWSKEKEELKKNIKELEAENKRFNEENYNLNLELINKKQEIDFLNKEKEKLNSSYKNLQEEINEIGKELIFEEEKENEKDDTSLGLQIFKIKNKIKDLKEKIKDNESICKNLKEKNKQLEERNSKLNKERYEAIKENLKVNKEILEQKGELFEMQLNNIKNTNVKNEKGINEKEINKKIEELKKDIDEKFKAAKQAVSDKEKNEKLEKKVSEQEEQLKATALGFDLKEQQEFDNYANKMRQENIREILNDKTIGDTMKQNSDNKNKNEILKEEYYLPFIFEDYKINNKWICLKKWSASLYEKKQDQDIVNKEEFELKSNEIVYDKNLIYKSLDDVFFENLEKSEGFSKINLQKIASKKIKIKKQSQNEEKEEKKKEEFDVENVDENSYNTYKNYNIYIRVNKDEILLGNQFCEAAVNILKNFPDADLYLLFIGNTCYFYLKEIPLQKFMEYCAFVQGCSLAARIQTYGEYLSMYINDIVTGSAAIERNNFKYFTKEDLQSIFSSLFSNRWFKCKDLTQPKQAGDFIPKEILSYPELLMKPLNKNEYAASKIIDKGLQHPYIEKEIETKVMEYDGNTVFWYKCDMQDPVTYLLSECIGLGNYGYIGRFYKRDGQGNYYPVALKLTLDSATHEGGSHNAIMKEIKAGKAAAVMGCDRMIYSNRAGLIELKNSNFIDEIDKNKFSNMFLDPLEFIKEKNKMNSENKDYKQLLLTKSDSEDASDIYCRKDKKMNIEKWDKETFKKAADYDYRINFLENRFKDFYNSEKFKKFQNLMFNKNNEVKNKLLYVMEMDIIDEKDEDLYTETTTEKIKNNEGNEENMKQNNKINEEDKEIDINDNIKKTINNIAEYLTAQYKCRVIHGDIKAKNMTKDKFLDFGSFDMVSNYETKPNFSDVVGTPEYWDLIRIFNKQLELVTPYDVLLKDYQLSDLYASIVALYYYMFKEYPAFATLIIIIKSILKHYINDVKNNKNYCNEAYEKNIEDFIKNFPIGNNLVKCTKAFEKDKKLKKQINKDIKEVNVQKEEKKKEEEEEEEEDDEEEGEGEKEKENLDKFNKYLKEVEDKNYLIDEVKQLRYCIYQIIQNSLLTVEDVNKEGGNVDKDKLFFIMSKKKEFYSKGEGGWEEVKKFTKEVVEKLIKIYRNLREQELKNLKCLIKNKDEKKNMLGRIMYQILQQGTFANSEKYPAFEVYKNEHSYNNEAKGKEDYRRKNLDYRKNKEELINKIRNKDEQEKIKKSFEEYKGFWEDYEARLLLRNKSYLYTLEPLSIKSLITQQPYYEYEKSFIDTINEEKKGKEKKE